MSYTLYVPIAERDALPDSAGAVTAGRNHVIVAASNLPSGSMQATVTLSVVSGKPMQVGAATV
jgi:hypothetical protein